MKKILLIPAVLIAAASVSFAAPKDKKNAPKKEEGYVFTDQKINNHGPIRNQQSSGTCWAFSGVSFLEGELLRNGKDSVNLSDMWIVRNNYYERAVRYVRMHGDMSFGEGSITPNVFDMYAKYGMVPEEAYKGLEYGTDTHRHGEMNSALKAYLDEIIKNPNRQLTTAWLRGVEGILDAYFGPKPEKFTYKGVEYTPQSFASMLGLDMNDYITVSSFTHHPFYTQFVLEVPDNWGSYSAYNVPIADFSKIISSSIEAGYNVVWASDVSEKGFKYNDGFAVVPVTKAADLEGSEKSKWTAMTQAELDSIALKLNAPGPERTITQEMRQQEFNNYLTTDDHGMVLMGTASDQNGALYYKVQNSWGESGKYKGFFYASEPFVLLKTTAIAVNKNTLPKEIADKLGIK